jgi:hypothetical protein
MPTPPEPPLQAPHLAGAALRIEHLPLAALRPAPRNPRTHSPRQLRQIANSIERFGFTNPVLLDAEGTIVAGHGRVAAARLLGLDSVPTLRLDHLGEAERRAYALADNKLAENAGWDRKLLALELQYVAELDISLRPHPHRLRNRRDRPAVRGSRPGHGGGGRPGRCPARAGRGTAGQPPGRPVAARPPPPALC